MTSRLAAGGLFRDPPFTLVDVGVSGGIDGYWEVFGDGLQVFGFDPLIQEVERLNTVAGGPRRHYYAFLAGDRSYEAPSGVPDTQPFARTSAARAVEIAKCDYAATYYDPSGHGQTTAETIELDQFFSPDRGAGIDFIKVDTDGSDYQTLRGARRLLSTGQVLGLAIECQFHGLVHDESNTFRNIDRLLTGYGFSLFDLEVYRYSRSALPQPFVYNLAAQTTRGQVLASDALYLLDAGARTLTLPAHKLVKLAAICEIFGLEDCAAEILLKYRPTLAALLDVDRCLDLLKPGYREHIRRFEKDPASLYPR